MLTIQTPGGWWDWPLWRKVLIWLALRPYWRLRGELAVGLQLIALRVPRLITPIAWVVPLPRSGYYPLPVDDLHPPDACFYDYHGLSYERSLDLIRSMADRFDLVVNRTWLTRNIGGDDEGAAATRPGGATRRSGD